jgi:hypothetical protein
MVVNLIIGRIIFNLFSFSFETFECNNIKIASPIALKEMLADSYIGVSNAPIFEKGDQGSNRKNEPYPVRPSISKYT